MSELPRRRSPRIFPNITPTEGVAIKARIISKTTNINKHIANIAIAERYLPITILVMLIGEVSKAWSVFCFLSSLKSFIVKSGITNIITKNID